MPNFLYEFDEVPLAIVDGAQVCLTDGAVEVQYSRDGNWTFDPNSIAVSGYREITHAERAAGKKPWIYVAAPIGIAHLIGAQLATGWFDRVQDAVNEQIERDRDDAADARSDMRREHRAGA